ncbi:hypothetical protein [Cytobacillus purgationiresistens]|uniref:Uncharacterized protein n=1 Tax=Cytobacillus purgationiresistens TaxID=863449 RepID=A0ABU0ADG9_9BACI|nr:hypothetical protein [Cytobacillus purgationiresistens]MDQ0268924.1 hypothetical protein [Cytobacillus purgationiresistens]
MKVQHMFYQEVIRVKLNMTEEKLLKLKPIFESILSRKYGKEIKITALRYGQHISVGDK